MPTEEIYNLFVFIIGNTIEEVGVALHVLEGTDDQKFAYLQSRVEQDHASAKRFRLITPLCADDYGAMQRLGWDLELFEGVLQKLNAPSKPLYVATVVQDGIPRSSASIKHGASTFSALRGTPLERHSSEIDYLEKYINENGFDIPQLINDDFFRAIKLLFNERLYVSASKLLMSCIDSIAFIEFGDESKNFTKWLETYANLAPLGITPAELWEYRNGILHMTNLHSRAVRNGRENSLILTVGDLKRAPELKDGRQKRLPFMMLWFEIAEAISRWVESYNKDRTKFIKFVTRYDLIVSDSRMRTIILEE